MMKWMHLKIDGGIINSEFQISGEWLSNKQLYIKLFILIESLHLGEFTPNYSSDISVILYNRFTTAQIIHKNLETGQTSYGPSTGLNTVLLHLENIPSDQRPDGPMGTQT